MNRNGLYRHNRTRIQSKNTLDLIMYVLVSVQSLTLNPYQTQCGATTSSGILADTFGAVPTIRDLVVSARQFLVRRRHASTVTVPSATR